MIRVGDKLGRFLLNRELGRGSNGVVYEATDTLLNAKVALKVLHPWLAGEPQVRERFKRELLLTRRVAHPGICRLFDLHEEKDTVFITMEFVEGCTLSQLLKDQGLLHPPRAIRLLRSTAQALSAAHQAGVIHRDLKPGNINVRPDDSVTILDFGIATATDVGRLTRPGQTVGSLRYIPPEVWEGSAATALGDIYALGVISYACLTGRLPYDAPGAVMMLEVLKSSKPTPISDINPQVDQALSDVVMKAMAIDPDKRYGSAGDFDHALEQLEDPELRAAFEPPSAEFEARTQEVSSLLEKGEPSGDATKVLKPAAPKGDDAAPTKVTAPMHIAPPPTPSRPSTPPTPAQDLPRAPPPGQSTVVVDAAMILAGGDDARPQGFSGVTSVGGPRPMATLDDGQAIADDAMSMVADLDVQDALGAAFDGALGPTTQPIEQLPADPFEAASVRPAMASKSTGPRGQDVQVVRVSKNSGPNTPATGGMPSAPSSAPSMAAVLEASDAPNTSDRDAALAALRVPTDPVMSVELNAPFLGSPSTDPQGRGAGATVPDHTMVAPAPGYMPDRGGGPTDSGDRTVVARDFANGHQADDDGLDAPAEATDPGPLEERRRRQTRNRMLIAAAGIGAVVVVGALVAAIAGKKPAPDDVAVVEPDGAKDEPGPDVKTDPAAVNDPAAVVAVAATDPAAGEVKTDPKPGDKPVTTGDDSWDLNPDDLAAKAPAVPEDPKAAAAAAKAAAAEAKAAEKAAALEAKAAEKAAALEAKAAEQAAALEAKAAAAEAKAAEAAAAKAAAAQVEANDDEPKDDAEPIKKERAAPRPGAKDRAAYTKAVAAFDKAMKKQGLVPGDLPDVDAGALRARLLAKQGKPGDAADAMEKAADMAASAKITRGMVLKKLDRFNKRYDKVETPAQKEKLKPLSTDISQKLASGDYEGANALLNKAFGILAKR